MVDDAQSVLCAAGLAYDLPDRSILSGVNFAVGAREVIAIVGPSGSGKTTLLQILAGIKEPHDGNVMLGGVDFTACSPDQRARYRLTEIGFVFQFGELLPELNVKENVGLPLRLAGISRKDADRAATKILQRIDMNQHTDASPNTLSGGESQRIAVARALVHGPKIVLADEPTGSLDQGNAKSVFALLVEVAQKMDAAVVIVTHNTDVAELADRTLRLADGVLVPAGEDRST